tara:strand:- start:1194 stop:1493 length:300 start_codon:yes stop_codon:yes gene_type:complete
MMETPEPVLLWIPLMKHLGMSWQDIKNTPRYELQGLLAAFNEHENLHSMDGYDDKDIADMAKNKPAVRSNWHKYLETQRKYNELLRREEEPKSFSSIVG